MKLSRRMFIGSLLGSAALAMTPRLAGADDWCSSDPPVTIITPAGKKVIVYVTDYALGTVHLPAIQAATHSYTVAPVSGERATDVTLTVNIPGDRYDPTFRTRSKVASAEDDDAWKKKYELFSDRYGVAGTPIVHKFRLDRP